MRVSPVPKLVPIYSYRNIATAENRIERHMVTNKIAQRIPVVIRSTIVSILLISQSPVVCGRVWCSEAQEREKEKPSNSNNDPVWGELAD